MITPARTDRYTLDGDERVEAQMGADQEVISEALAGLMQPPEFQALVLMGGYGRGEGGFFFVKDRPYPYNDYDYFIITRRLSKPDQRALQPKVDALCDKLAEQVNVAVDMAFLREEDIPHLEYNLMHAEMQWGHRVVAGNPNILDAMPDMPIETLPLGEFTRLMHNRGTLLLMNQLMLSEEGEPQDPKSREKFVKYIFKSVRAIVDALLAAEDRYDPSYATKKALLPTVQLDYPHLAQLIADFDLAFEAKFHPDFSEHIKQDLPAWQQRGIVAWLAAMRLLEQVRTGGEIRDWGDYARLPKDQSGHGLKSLARNTAITLRDYSLGEVLTNPIWSLRYPRERIVSSLPLLLAHIDEPAHPALIKHLKIPAGSDWTTAAHAYLEQWPRYA